MDEEKGGLNNKFSFNALPDGSLEKNKIICTIDVNRVNTVVREVLNTASWPKTPLIM